MKEMFTPSKTDIFVGVAPVAYEHSRAARVFLRIFFFLPMSIVAGTILPMFLFNINDWSLLLFLPFMIGVPVLTFFILGEHPEDRAIREANQARQLQQANQTKKVIVTHTNEQTVNNFSLEDALEKHRHAFDNLNHLKTNTQQNQGKKKQKRQQNQGQQQNQQQKQNQQKKARNR